MTAFPLPASLDTAAAPVLHGELLARLAGRRPLALDGADVCRAGQACLQVLASARAAAAAQSLPFRIDNASDALAEMVGLAGLDAVLEPLG